MAPSDRVASLRDVDVEAPKAQNRDLTPEDRRALWAQFADVHADAQKVFDASLRTLAAGAIAVTVSLATVLGDLGDTGVVAVVLFLTSLLFNLVSYSTAQRDMRVRLAGLRAWRTEEIEGTRWTTATYILNWLAGLSFIAGAALLAAFVATGA